MKLIRIAIHNYRGIIDQTIKLQNYSLLAGANNAGKSTVIDAIRAFYEKDGFKFQEKKDTPFKKANGKESWVELTFSLTDDEYNSLAEEYQNGQKLLRVRKFFLTPNNNQASKVFGYRKDGSLSDSPFYGAKNVQNGKFGNIIYIPAISRVDEHTKLTGPSALRDLVTSIMSDVVENSDAYKTLSSAVSSFAHEVKSLKTSGNQSLSGLEGDLNEYLSAWEVKFDLKFIAPSTGEIIKSMLNWDIQDEHHNQSQNIECFGSGFQRYFIYSLIRLRAEYVLHIDSYRKKTDKKDFVPSFNLILFEEPEAFLHPPQQEELSRGLIKLGDSENWQVLCSTHSTHFVSRNTEQIFAITRLQKSEGIISALQVTEDKWQSIVASNQQVNEALKVTGDDLQERMESIKYFLWLNPDRAGLFFSNYVLLVEGPSEKAFINKLIDDGKINLPKGTYVLDGMGKYNIPRFMNLLGALGINHSVLHDDDLNKLGKEKEKHEKLNALIVNSSQKGTTIKITPIPNDLEIFLNVNPAGRPNRKPQHILYLYATGNIQEEKIKNFCQLVESLFHSAETTIEPSAL